VTTVLAALVLLTGAVDLVSARARAVLRKPLVIIGSWSTRPACRAAVCR